MTPCPNCGGWVGTSYKPGRRRTKGDGHQEQQTDGHMWFAGFTTNPDGPCLTCEELGLTAARCTTCNGTGQVR
jgi:hypothetical protein